jgi:FkbH-like protein
MSKLLESNSIDELQRRHRRLRREMRDSGKKLTPKRIAILGGSTTASFVDFLDLFLLESGVDATFYQSDYGLYFEEAVYGNEVLKTFAPDLCFVFTTVRNIEHFPAMHDSPESAEKLLNQTVEKFQAIWSGIRKQFHVPIIQNNFEFLPHRELGNLDAADYRGKNHFILELNRRLSEEILKTSAVHLNDLHYLSSSLGLQQWHDKKFWYAYKYAMSTHGCVLAAQSAAAIVRAILGKSKKCLVLDLDNTLWGGVIGDDGEDGIRLGAGDPMGEAHQDLQAYASRLSDRGIILAVASKNEHDIAKTGFSHGQSKLRYEDFGSFKANWGPKDSSIKDIGFELNIGLDAMVFIDDNPAERLRVSSEIPDISVPEIPEEALHYVDALDRAYFFEPLRIVPDDLKRKQFYADNLKRSDLQATFANYDDYLKSLEMTASIKRPNEQQLERVTQLINKTNQFNLTTLRLTRSQVDEIWANDSSVLLAGSLKDRFGDNGLISVVIGHKQGHDLNVDLWIMSCRVLKRGMEVAMFDALVAEALRLGCNKIKGRYLPTAKNGLVRNHYKDLNFQELGNQDGATTWHFTVTGPQKLNRFIGVQNGET